MLTLTPVVNAVGYMNRLRRSVKYARTLLASRRILGFSAHWVNGSYGVPWWLDERSSRGAHNEQATHLFDLARYLCGEVEQLSSFGTNRIGGDPTRSVATTLRFASGALGTVLYSCEAQKKYIGVRVFTSDGSVAFATWDFALIENTINDTVLHGPSEDIFLLETSAFVNTVRSGASDSSSPDWIDACRTQRVMDAVRRSLGRRTPNRSSQNGQGEAFAL